MNENIKTNQTVPSPTKEQKPSPAFNPRDNSTDEYFDDYMNDNLYYDNLCMSCKHWIGGVCNHEHRACNYEPFSETI